MKFSKEQQLAIDTHGTNIIVSAGAGSGKTAVLTERIFQMLKNGYDISRLLVLTFTKPAALEMKTRIKKRVKKDPTLESQYNKIDSAYITTFDSFALSVVKKYHYLLNVSKNIKIVDGIVMMLKKDEIINEVFNELYVEENEGFFDMLNKFTHKDDKLFKSSILKMAEGLQKQPYKDIYLSNYIADYYSENKIDYYINEYVKECNNRIKDLRPLALELYDMITGTKPSEAIMELLDFISYDHTYPELVAYVRTFKIPVIKGSPEASEVKKKLNEKLSKYDLEFMKFDTIEDIKNTIYETKAYALTIIEILTRYFNKLISFKMEKGLFEFDDISMMVLQLFDRFPQVLKEVSLSFDEILLDEYQDTSDIQEAFISKISRNNVYMVGDIKQSIYRFRDANPYIFKDKYDNYKNNNGGFKIDLNKNFRSRHEVLSNINLLFSYLMKNECGDADYKKEHQMNFGNTSYLDNQVDGFNYNQEYLFYTPDEDKYYSNSEIEAFIIADKINELMTNKHRVYDKDNNSLRDIKYQDIAVILPRKANVELLQKIFTSKGIPYCLSIDEKISNSFIIRVFNSLFNLINTVDSSDIETYKFYFVSVARSFLFRQTDNLILSESFDDFKNNEIYEKAKKVKYFSRNNSVTKTFEYMLEEFNVYESLIKIGDINQQLAVINYVSEMISGLKDLNYNFSDIAKHFEEIIDRKIEIPYENKTKNNGVILINIHKSKGLEYPICFFADLDSEFNRTDIKESFLFDKYFGLITPYYSDREESSILKILYKNKYIKEDVSERVRLFYVALTRAREKMYFVMPNYDNLKKSATEFEFISYSSFITYYFDEAVYIYGKNVDYEDLVDKDYLEFTQGNYKEAIKKKDCLVYPKRNFKSTLLEKVHISKVNNELLSSEEAKFMNLGIKLHEILQTIDLVKKDYSKLNLTENEKRLLENLLKLACFSKLENAKVYKELEFEYSKSGKKYHGIIDLLVEYDDHFEIIDYKLSDIEKPDYVKQLNEYYNYLRQITDKNIKMYLLSITKGQLKEVFVVQ